jgi:hypothetical protein
VEHFLYRFQTNGIKRSRRTRRNGIGRNLKNQFSMASRWDLANGWDSGNDHGLFNIGDEPGAAKWNARPAFYYMYYFQKYFGDRMVTSTVTGSSDIYELCLVIHIGAGGYYTGEQGQCR